MMQIKFCNRTGECDPSFVRSCAHALAPREYAIGFYTPRNTGEHCDHYQRAIPEIDLHAELMAKMGAHQ